MDFGNEVEWALFRGIEQEGPLKGQDTLFVVGDVPFELILNEITKKRLLNVYFGAGGRFDYNELTAIQVADISNYPVGSIVLESPEFDAMLFKMILFRHSAIWVIPYIWHGQILQRGLHFVEHLNSMQYASKDKIYGKVDFAKRVIIHPLTDTYLNFYSEGYSEDVLIASKER